MNEDYDESVIHHSMYVHIIWSTMAQQPLLHAVTQHLHDYICNLALLQSCHVISCRILSDHIQLVVKYSPNTYLERLITTLKAETSSWIRSNYSGLENFEWQKSDLSFSISGDGVKSIINSMNNTSGYPEELCKILKNNGVTIDPKEFLE